MRKHGLIPWTAALAALFLSGCTGLRLRPDPEEPVKASGAPVALSVGIALEEGAPAVEARGFNAPLVAGQAPEDFGALLADALRAARLFSEVRYPLPSGAQGAQPPDLVLSCGFKRSYRGDPGKVPKVMVNALFIFLPTPLIIFSDEHGAAGRVAARGAGGWGKDYEQSVTVTASWRMFSEMRSYKEGPAAAAKILTARLAQALAADRSVFEGLARDKASRPAAVPAPSAGPAAAPAPSAGPAAAPAPSAAPPPKPKPKADWDDQIVP